MGVGALIEQSKRYVIFYWLWSATDAVQWGASLYTYWNFSKDQTEYIGKKISFLFRMFENLLFLLSKIAKSATINQQFFCKNINMGSKKCRSLFQFR